MSKISPLIVTYLAEHPQLSLEGFGTFTVKNNSISDDGEKINAEAVEFQHQPNVQTDELFLQHVIKYTGKIKPLAAADLETYLNQSKQLLNISKPVVIDGLGTLNKTAKGVLEFTPGVYEFQRMNTDYQKDVSKEAVEKPHHETSLSFNTDYRKGTTNKKPIGGKVLGAVAVFALLAGLVYVGYKFVFSGAGKTSTTSSASSSASAKPSAVASAAAPAIPTTVDSLGRSIFRIAVRETDSASAYSRRNTLRGSNYEASLGQSEKLMQVEVDKNAANSKHRVFIVLRAKPADTAAFRATVQSNYVGTSMPFTAYYF